MYTRLPSTYELIQGLTSPPLPPTRLLRMQKALWRIFAGVMLMFLATAAGGVVYRYQLGLNLPQWFIGVIYALLGLCALFYAALLAVLAVPVGRIFCSPMRWLSSKMDGDAAAENALLRKLSRIPPTQLRSRQRRVEVELALWEGASRTVTLLTALGPAALIVVGSVVPLPASVGIGSVLPAYAGALVLGCGFAVFVQQQCSRPLRRLVHVLAEAAEIGDALQRNYST